MGTIGRLILAAFLFWQAGCGPRQPEDGVYRSDYTEKNDPNKTWKQARVEEAPDPPISPLPLQSLSQDGTDDEGAQALAVPSETAIPGNAGVGYAAIAGGFSNTIDAGAGIIIGGANYTISGAEENIGAIIDDEGKVDGIIMSIKYGKNDKER